MNLVRINTSAFSEEDFILMTDLSAQDIKMVVSPMVNQERDSDEMYSNDDYYWSLKDAYPKATIEMYQEDSIEVISF
jgi:hypothetical protein